MRKSKRYWSIKRSGFFFTRKFYVVYKSVTLHSRIANGRPTFLRREIGPLEEKSSYSFLASELSHINRTLGHPARIALLIEITKRGGIIQNEALEIPQLSQATIMQHLRELKRSGIIQGRIFGARSNFKIDDEKLKAYKKHLDDFMQQIHQP